ncbi:MAG: universal stress protein [Deltaproteobacteria bacterium]|nr:universal stress protein [Deltaproteobacteria bacterium]
MEIKKILWPTDFSDNSNSALPCVLSLSEKYGAEIHLLYVAEEIAHSGSWYGEITASQDELQPSVFEELHKWEVPRAERKMEEICKKELAGCPMFYKHVIIGDPAQEILNTIEKQGVDVVVMATQGGKGRFHFGSVADKVVRNSSVPVWTVRPTTKK